MKLKLAAAAGLLVALCLAVAALQVFVFGARKKPAAAVSPEQKAELTKSRVGVISDDLVIIRGECGKYPESLDELVGSGFCSKSCPQVECLEFEDLRDAWDKRIEYFHDSERLTVRSLGKDGREGGEGENADAVVVLPMNPD